MLSGSWSLCNWYKSRKDFVLFLIQKPLQTSTALSHYTAVDGAEGCSVVGSVHDFMLGENVCHHLRPGERSAVAGLVVRGWYWPVFCVGGDAAWHQTFSSADLFQRPRAREVGKAFNAFTRVKEVIEWAVRGTFAWFWQVFKKYELQLFQKFKCPVQKVTAVVQLLHPVHSFGF